MCLDNALSVVEIVLIHVIYRFSTKFHPQSCWPCYLHLTEDDCYPEEQIKTNRTQILIYAFYKCSTEKQEDKGDFAIAGTLFRHISITEWNSEVPSDCQGILVSLGITGFCLTAYVHSAKCHRHRHSHLYFYRFPWSQKSVAELGNNTIFP